MFGTAVITSIRDDNIIEARSLSGIQMYLNRDSYDQILSPVEINAITDHAIEQDDRVFTAQLTKTNLRQSKHSYHIKTQTDSGANVIVTRHKHLLHHYKKIKSHGILGVKADDIAINVLGKGYIKWTSNQDQTLWIPCFYSPDVDDTIILSLIHISEPTRPY